MFICFYKYLYLFRQCDRQSIPIAISIVPGLASLVVHFASSALSWVVSWRVTQSFLVGSSRVVVVRLLHLLMSGSYANVKVALPPPWVLPVLGKVNPAARVNLSWGTASSQDAFNGLNILITLWTSNKYLTDTEGLHNISSCHLLYSQLVICSSSSSSSSVTIFPSSIHYFIMVGVDITFHGYYYYYYLNRWGAAQILHPL